MSPHRFFPSLSCQILILLFTVKDLLLLAAKRHTTKNISHHPRQLNIILAMASPSRLLYLSISILFIVSFTIHKTLAFASAETEIDINSEQHIMPTYPSHWGQPPLRQTKDYVLLPGDYGRGSGTVKKWIEEKMAEDETARKLVDDKKLWPEKILVGLAPEDAKAAVLADGSISESNIYILPHDAMVTMDYREDRVRIFVGDDGLVISQPVKG